MMSAFNITHQKNHTCRRSPWSGFFKGLTVACVLLALPAFSQTMYSSPVGPVGPSGESPVEFRFGGGLMYSFGENFWQEKTGFVPTVSGPVRVVSDLEYNELTSLQLLLAAEVNFNQRFGVSGRFHIGSFSDGEGADTDYIEGAGLDGFRISKSEDDLDGDTYGGQIRAHLLLPENEVGKFDLFIGYLHQTDNTTSKNGVQTIIDEERVSQPFSGLASTYDFEWHGLEVGARGVVPVNDRGLSIGGSFAVSPFLSYEGEGFWNLRDDFKRTPPNFIHEADGVGISADLSLNYARENYHFSLGYFYQNLQANDGTSETFFADGDTGFSDLEAESTWQGVLLGAGVAF